MLIEYTKEHRVRREEKGRKEEGFNLLERSAIIGL
jgi:hypothetical protein